MNNKFWIKRFVTVLVGTFAILCVTQLLKGHGVAYSATQGALWGTVSALIFTVARFFQARRGQHCAICKDTPEMQQHHRPEL